MKKYVMDFGHDRVSVLFVRLFVPALIGMFFTSIFIMVDGIMVGRGVGPEGLAAVNLVSPLFTISTGIGLMFGIGGSVLASISLGKGKPKEAGLFMTHALVVSALVGVLLMVLILLFPDAIVHIFGTPPELYGAAMEYMDVLAPALFFNVLLTVGLFFIRLDGSPNYAMTCVAVGAISNIVLDYLFIFPLGWGLWGAGFATMLSQIIGCLMMLVYMLGFTKIIRLRMGQFKRRSLSLLVNNSVRIISLGFSAFLGDLAISFMIIIGNLVFAHALGVDGVAAFSVSCFLFPMIFMAYNAIVQSAQPIISYNFSRGAFLRMKQASVLSLKVALLCAVLFLSSILIGKDFIISLFLEPSTAAYAIASVGIGWFAVGFLFFGINIVAIGYMQSVKLAQMAGYLSVLRGVVLMLACFIILPPLLGEIGIWIAVPVAELLTLCLIVGLYMKGKITPSDAVNY